MFDLCSERLLNDEEKFAPRDGHRFAEIWVSDVSFGLRHNPVAKC